MRFLALFLGFALVACQRSEPPPEADPDGAVAAPRPGRPPALYERRFLFLAGTDVTPQAAVLEFLVLDEGGPLRRVARGWTYRGAAWERSLEASWEMEPMRDPWRIVPHGPLRVMAGDNGELQALVHRARPAVFRLATRDRLAGWSAEGGAQFGLLRAELRHASERAVGVLLDVQLGRPTGGAGSASAAAGNGAASLDGAGPYDEAFLTDGRNFFLVTAAAPAIGAGAWVPEPGEEYAVAEGRLVPSAGVDGAPAWRIVSAEPLRGEVRAFAEPLTAPTVAGLPPTLVAIYLVRGWIETAGGARRTVFGLVRRGHG